MESSSGKAAGSLGKEVCFLAFASVLSALAAGSMSTAMQQMDAIPLIIKAEAYEVEEVPPVGTELDVPVAAHAHHHSHADEVDESHHNSHVDEVEQAEDDEWFPTDGAPRHICTLVSNIVVMWGYGLMLLGCFLVRDRPVGGPKAVQDGFSTILGGICWGAATFVAFGLAPGLNLPPELPGMVAAELESRQLCWVFTALMTSAGLLLFTAPTQDLKIKVACIAAGVLFVIVPQLVGGPHYEHLPGGFDRPPPELAAQFAVSALAAQGLSFLCLGVTSATAFNAYLRLYGGADEAPMMQGGPEGAAIGATSC